MSPSMGNDDRQEQLSCLLTFMVQRFIYVRDPNGIEFMVSPLQMVKQFNDCKKIYGDCDDHVLFLNSMLNSLGWQTKVAAVRLQSEVYDHVISLVWFANMWMQIDTCSKSNPYTNYQGEMLIV